MCGTNAMIISGPVQTFDMQQLLIQNSQMQCVFHNWCPRDPR